MTVVAKFGGTSVADYQAMCRCADIIIQGPSTRVVVLSASSGVTNLLVELTHADVTDTRRTELLRAVNQIQQAIIEQLPAEQAPITEIDKLLKRMTQLSEMLVLDRSRALMDELLSIGEQCSSLLFSAILRNKGMTVECFDIRQVMRTDSHFGCASPDVSAIAELTKAKLMPLLAKHIVVTQGFIGADSQGQTTTLGRGGSDYSAAILAEAIRAKALEIWTDVPGIFTTDPRFSPGARVLKEICFNEAAEMATFGAKILHPATILPAVRQKIKVFVGSSREPEKGGTWIRHQVDSEPVYRAVAVRRGQILLNLHSLQMLHAQGFLAQIFTTLAKHKISVDLITTSEVNVSLTLDKTGSDSSGIELLSEALLAELAKHCRVVVEDKLALVAIIGNHIATTPGICKQVFSLLESFNIRMICQGASPHNLCLLVAEQDATDIANLLHISLFESSD